MGRSKNPPKRRPVGGVEEGGDGRNDDESLGARFLGGLRREALLLEELVQNNNNAMGMQPLALQHKEEEDNELMDDDSSHQSPTANNNKSKRSTTSSRKKAKTATTTRSRRPSETRSAAPRVRFAELQITSLDENGETHWEMHVLDDNNHTTTIHHDDDSAQVRRRRRQVESSSTPSSLRAYQLNRTHLRGSYAVIRTMQGATTLLQHCEALLRYSCANDPSNNEPQQDIPKLNVDAIGTCVRDGTMVLHCRNATTTTTPEAAAKNILQVNVCLTERAFEICSAPSLPPPSSRRRPSKRYLPVRNLQTALASIFADTVVADVVTVPHSSSSSSVITAKNVYDLIDNVKLGEYEANGGYENGSSSSIPGLVPTLRPYQEAAVQWMLRRERGEETTKEEWELAWVVLTQPPALPQPPSEEEGVAVATGKVLTLSDWKKREQCDGIEKGLLLCPFFGLLARSSADAYQQTLDSVVSDGASREWTAPSGGILAESMGLGKTVEVLACILANRFEPDDEKLIPLFDTTKAEIQEEKKGKDDSSPPTVEEAHVVQSDKEDEEFEFGEDDALQKQGNVSAVVTPEKGRPENLLEEWSGLWGACICGESDAFCGCLSIVLCRSCRRPMHGVCAGFESLEQVQCKTRWERDFDSGLAVRTCSLERCPCCVFSRIHDTNNRIPSRATLIITPTPILAQWERELRRHTTTTSTEMSAASDGASPISSGQLKIVVYPGIRELCSKRNHHRAQLMHPMRLADADIVLMTFDSLMADLGHSDENPYLDDSANQRLRSSKRYRVAPSPLTSIRWWRVCLDEAQRVEAPTAASAKMALKLVSQHRWCVSGTPVGRGKLDDLYGLFLFLGITPFSTKAWYQKCLQSSHRGIADRIRHLLSSTIWRSTKESASVSQQMHIPDQIEQKTLLKFSSIERHFYERQLEQTMLVVGDVLGKDGSARKRKSADDLLAGHLHRLRAACCHPQVGSSGIGRPKRKRRMLKSHADDSHGEVSVGSAVLTMEQILDRLIDDAKTKCEEAQRLAVMHTNAMASLEHLKVEAKQSGVSFSDSDEQLLRQSCRTYMESLDLTDSNATPSLVVGEAMLSGSSGFLFHRKIIRDGSAKLQWQMRTSRGEDIQRMREVWSRIDFEGPARKIIKVKIRPSNDLPIEALDEVRAGGTVRLAMPKTVVFQVSNAALGGEFVDVASFSLGKHALEETSQDSPAWVTQGGFRTNKSKSWRLVVKDYQWDSDDPESGADTVTTVVGVEIQVCEADIAADSLQRLHVLHNASLTMTLLLQTQAADAACDTFMSVEEMKEKLEWIKGESLRIEALYLDMARSVHSESQRRLRGATEQRVNAAKELWQLSLHSQKRTSRPWRDCWDDGWWDDVLSIYVLYGSPHERLALCERVHRDLDDFVYNTQKGKKHMSKNAGAQRYRDFPNFHDVDGLRAALHFRFSEFRETSAPGSFSSCIECISRLSPEPDDNELFENSHCEKCRKDWNQKGPECRHCKLETKLNGTSHVDPILLTILRSLYRTEAKGSGKLVSARKETRVDARAEKFFAVLDAMEKETRTSLVAWRTHFDLLSDLDEMNQCKRTIRLAVQGEDLSKLTQDELGSVVYPWDIAARYMDHGAKQAMALANLRRSKDTLRYLKNQSKECLEELQHECESEKKAGSTNDNNCPLCLAPFGGEYAVLACGHRFHYSPCLEKLMARSGSQSSISCPLRCPVSTKRSSIMIATDKRKDDGSRINREVKGSWGTKVTKLVADVMDVSDLGEKSIVFSQWEDMLEVVEHALEANGVQYVRARSLSKMGEAIKKFRSSDCTVLLMNVKNGAEGLTIVEATHVFMVEPLLNCGLDSQAISRIHRIGQTRKTYVHRYLIQDTIEAKIDAIRMERLAITDQLEDALYESRKKHDVGGGGIDGGFSENELQELLRL